MSKLVHGPFTDSVIDWEELDDAELRTRLMHRHVDIAEAKTLVASRAVPNVARQIAEYMVDPVALDTEPPAANG